MRNITIIFFLSPVFARNFIMYCKNLKWENENSLRISCLERKGNLLAQAVDISLPFFNEAKDFEKILSKLVRIRIQLSFQFRNYESNIVFNAAVPVYQ